MTDNEITKALEYCSTDIRENTCPKCAFYKKHRCSILMLNAVSDLINRQRIEIERMENQNTLLLKKKCKDINTARKIIKSEAIKEFAERLDEMIYATHGNIVDVDGIVLLNHIDDDINKLVKEMTEGK